MKNSKTRFINLILCVTLLLNVILPAISFSQARNRGGATQKCIIVSDIHFDPLYGSKNDSLLKKKLEKSSFDEWKRLFENSAPQMTLDSTLFYKDANYAVLSSALFNMQRKIAHPAFIVIAGDFLWHNATPADSILKKKVIQFIALLFKEHFPGVPIIPAMGNNDTYGDDYEMQDARFLKDFADAWAPNLPKSSGNELKEHGYYTWQHGPLKLIVINSALLSYGTNYPQASAMFKWLQENLSNAKGKNVWIISHIPPGLNGYNDSNMWNAAYTQTFANSVVKYSSIIKFGIASHTHFNDFKVFYNASKVPVSFMRIVPSICSNHGNNPSFDVAEFDDVTNRVVHETNWYLNLKAVPRHKSITEILWTDHLSLPSSLNITKIEARDFSKLMDNIKTDKTGRLLKEYVRFYNVGTKTDSSKTINRRNFLNYLKADSLKAN